MTTPESVLTLTLLIISGILLVSALYRLTSLSQASVLYLAGYTGLVFLAHLAHLMELLVVEPVINVPYAVLSDFMGLAGILAFGALTHQFLSTPKNLRGAYGFGSAAILLAWSAMSLDMGGAAGIFATTYTPVIAAVGWGVALSSVFLALGVALRKRPSSKHRNRLRYWFIISILHLGSGLVYFLSPAHFYGAGSFLLTLGMVLAGYVVLQYHAPDLNQLVGRALMVFVTTGVLAAVFYLALASTVVLSRSSVQPIDMFFYSIILAIGLAIITPPIWQYGSKLLARAILGKPATTDKDTISRFSRSLSSALDLQRLGEILIGLMGKTFKLEDGAIFFNERGASTRVSLRPLAKLGNIELTPFEFASDSLFVDYFRADNKFLFQFDIDVLPQFATMDAAERAWISGLNMEFFVPILRHKDVMGFLAFGRRRQKAGFLDEEVNLAVTLADQAALAIDSARLFEQLGSINQEIESLNEQFKGLDKNKSEFLSIASHELRTPLTHIHGYSRMLLDLTEEEARDFAYVKTIVAGIAKGSERMKSIIDMMFDVTEANEGEMDLALGPVNLADVVKRASGPFMTALDERRIAFAISGFDDLPIIEADGSRLTQAVQYLLSNAIKYTPDGGLVKVVGQPVVVDNLGSVVQIAVIDTGIGINPEHHKSIFEKFFRVDDSNHHSTSSTKFKGGGPGLGLTLVKGIAEAHGGSVWVESSSRNEKTCPGSKFILQVPLHPIISDKKDRRRQSQIETVDWSRKLSLPGSEFKQP